MVRTKSVTSDKIPFLHSLKFKFVVLLLAITLVPLLAASLFLVSGMGKALDQQTDQSMRNQAQLNSMTINTWLLQKINTVRNLVDSHPVIRSNASHETVLPILKDLKMADPEVITYAYITAQGESLNTSDAALNVTKFANYKRISTEKTIGVSDIAKDGKTGQNIILIDVPILNASGDLTGIIQSKLDPIQISKVMEGIKFGESGYGFLISQKGTILAHPQAELIGKHVSELSAQGLAKLEASLAQPEGQVELELEDQTQLLAFYTVPETGWRLCVVMNAEEAGEVGAAAKKLSLLIVIVSALAVALIAFLAARQILKPVQAITLVMNKTATGDLSHRLPEKGRDEMAVLRRNINSMLDAFCGSIGRIVDSAHYVAAASEELTASAEQSTAACDRVLNSVESVVGGARTQREAAIQTSNATNEMALGIQRIAESTSGVAESAERVEREITSGNESVQTVIQKIRTANQAVKQSADQVWILQEQSMKIQMIIKVISEISTQTNLLALNASIEAARAGEQGRGFAVVAGEVKKLAEQTARSAIEIESIINESLESVEAVNASMTEGSREVQEGEEKIQEIGLIFNRIVEAIGQAGSQIQEVSAVSEEISAGTEEVASAAMDGSEIAGNTLMELEEVQQSVEEQQFAMKDVNESAASLRRMSEELQEMVGGFKIKD